MSKIHNFSAGPSILAESAFEKSIQDIRTFAGTGLSSLEVSHRRKEFEKTQKVRVKDSEKTDKANELSERNQMKEQDIASKAINLKKKKKTATKKVKDCDCESLASTVIMTDSEDEEIHIRFQNLPLIDEINSIRNVKKFKNFKKLSAGVKLARQILDI